MSNEKIELKLKDWLFNAGLLGFINILGEEARNNGELEIDDKNRLIRFSPKVLENFEYKYFDFFIKRYGRTLPYYKIIEFQKDIDEFNDKNVKIYDKNIEKLKQKISEMKETVCHPDQTKMKSYKSSCDKIEKDGEKKILKLYKEIFTISIYS